jgi:Cdc6-like AAA superfamily ATPase
LIIRDPTPLRESFLPNRIIHRDSQISALRETLRSLVEGTQGRHAFIHGPTGTGKTCTSRHVSEGTASEVGSVRSVYINCWEHSSRYSVLFRILESLGPLLAAHRKGSAPDELIMVLRKHLESSGLVVMLDEVDALTDFSILYDLILLERVSILMISNRDTALSGVDDRIRSRLSSMENILFPRYSRDELIDILKDRAELGILPDKLPPGLIRRMAESSGGDARTALSMLMVVAEKAESRELETIPDKIPDVGGIPEKDVTEYLNEYQRILLDIIKSRGEIDSATLYKELLSASSRAGLGKVVDRTFRNYVSALSDRNLVKISGTGRWTRYSAQ